MPSASDPAHAKKVIPLEANHVKQGIIKELFPSEKLSGISLTRPRFRGSIVAMA
jgi:hypothetical protein